MRNQNGAAASGTQEDKWVRWGRSHQARDFSRGEGFFFVRAGVSAFAQMVRRLTKMGRRVLDRHRALVASSIHFVEAYPLSIPY